MSFHTSTNETSDMDSVQNMESKHNIFTQRAYTNSIKRNFNSAKYKRVSCSIPKVSSTNNKIAALGIRGEVFANREQYGDALNDHKTQRCNCAEVKGEKYYIVSMRH